MCHCSNKISKAGCQDYAFWPLQCWGKIWRPHGDKKYYILKIFLFCFSFSDGAIIVLKGTREMVSFHICGEFQLQSCTFSTFSLLKFFFSFVHRLPIQEDNRFSVVFLFSFRDRAYVLGAAWSCSNPDIFLYTVPFNTLLKGVPKALWML